MRISEIRTKDLQDPIEGFETGNQNRLVIERDVLPIIFIAGIMGSRLERPQGQKKYVITEEAKNLQPA